MCIQVGFEKATKLYDIAHKDKDAHAVDFVTNCMRQKVCCLSSALFAPSLACTCTGVCRGPAQPVLSNVQVDVGL